MATERHRILLVEDDPDIAKSLGELFRMVGWETIPAPTLEDFRARLAEGGHCLGIHDLEIPALTASLKAHVDAGVLAIEEHREAYPRTSDSGMHYLPLLCMSAFARDHRAGRRARRAGADDTIVKPLDDNDEPLIDTVRRLLRESGRADHADCARTTALARREATEPPPSSPARNGLVVVPGPARAPEKNRLVVTGEPAAGKNRTAFTLNGRAVSMTNSKFLVLMKLVEARQRGLGPLTKEQLGSREEDNFRGTSMMQAEVAFALVPGTQLYTAERKVGYELSSDVVVEGVDVDTLAKHEEITVRNIAAKLRKLPAR